MTNPRVGCDKPIDAVHLAADVASKTPILPGMLRPPALVCEYMGGGSVRAALSRKAEFIKTSAARVKIALDAARG